MIDVVDGKGGRVARTSARALGSALLVLGACASDEPAPTQDARVQAFIDRYASVYCERVGACCGGNGRTPLDECVATARTYGSHVATPGLTFDQPSADACLASFDTYVCDAEHYRGPCHDVFRTAAFRTRQVDQSCETSSDCALPEKGGASC